VADQHPIPSLSAARDRTIEELSTRFASDDLSLEELDARLELAYKAKTIEQLQLLTADFVRPAQSIVPPALESRNWPAPSTTALEHDSIVAVMSDTKRQGLWAVPQHLDVFALMSNATIDLSRASLPAGIIDIRIRSTMSSMTIILPPGVRVASRVHNVMSSVSTADELDQTAPIAGAPVIRLSGWALMSDLKTVVRWRRELDRG
jgi:hypothetical protein